jgi:hypothetical protein
MAENGSQEVLGAGMDKRSRIGRTDRLGTQCIAAFRPKKPLRSTLDISANAGYASNTEHIDSLRRLFPPQRPTPR